VGGRISGLGCGEVLPFARFVGAVEGQHLRARARPARDQARQFRFIEAPQLFIERPVARKLAGGGALKSSDPRVFPARSGRLDAPNIGAPSCGAPPLGDAPGLLAHFGLESFDESPGLDDLRGEGVLDLPCAAVVESSSA
jgi:hypothetical protein